VLELLRRQQCSNGSFRVEPATPTSSCSGDPDATSIAVQAYAVAGEPADRALDWLLDQQQPEGSFRGSATTPEPNANSTGLATQALQAGIELQRDDPSAADRFRQARDRATSWTADLARGTAASAAGVNGAIAYDQDAVARASSVDDSDEQRDQWRRSTAQGILALAPVPLGRIGSARLQDASATAAAAGPVDADDSVEPSVQLLLLAAALAFGALVASVTILVRRRTRNRESR
jgi:hypothetical protein